ncbi:MAG TPA: pirin family protein [Kofleriaceae bacterium]|nr:pirin family protein [Kofleriaceae bacterium]
MIHVRRAEARRHDRRHQREIWRTFDPRDRTNSIAGGFGSLELLDEGRLPPSAPVPRQPRGDAEIVTCVREGAIAYEDSMGCSGVILAGEFHRMAAVHGLRHGEANASRTDWAHVLQIRLRPSAVRLESEREQKRFSAAERRGGLRIIASPDAQRGSLRLHQDARIYSALLERGQHVVHALLPGRGAWLHLVHGQLSLGDLVLSTGDGAAITAERAVSLTAREDTEILLVDLVAAPS